MVETLLSDNCVYVVMGNYGGHHKPCTVPAHLCMHARAHTHTCLFLRLKKSPWLLLLLHYWLQFHPQAPPPSPPSPLIECALLLDILVSRDGCLPFPALDGGLQDGGRVRRGDHPPPYRYIKNTSACGTTSTEHLLKADRTPQTSKKSQCSSQGLNLNLWGGRSKSRMMAHQRTPDSMEY